MHHCKACGASVPNPKERRSLESASSGSVRNGLFQFSRKVEENYSRLDDDHFSHGYVCKKCFLLVERCLGLTSKLMEVERTITSNLTSAFVSFGLCESQDCARGTKRCQDPSSSSHNTCTPKRMRLENSASPSVVVSLAKRNRYTDTNMHHCVKVE